MSGLRRVLVSAFLLSACGGTGDGGAEALESPSGASGAAGHAGAGHSAAGHSGAGAGGGNANTEMPCDMGGHELTQVKGTLHDDKGASVSGSTAQTCLRLSNGKAICVKPESVAADGAFTLAIPDAMQCVSHAVLRVTAHSTAYSTLYCVLEGAPQQKLDPPLALATIPPATSLPPEGDADHVRTITFDDGLSLDAAPSALLSPNGGYVDLGARRVVPDPRCFPGGAYEGSYAFHPEMNVTGGSGKIRIPNTTHLPAGTEVELFVMGGLSCMRPDGSPIEEGTVEAFGTAKVDATGAFLEGGAGLPCLTWLAYRKK